MKYRVLLLLWVFAANVHANVALDELNRLLAKKSPTTTVTSTQERPSLMLKNIKENYYFIFIYKGSCPHCHKFAPILKDFVTTFNFEVMPFSLDHEPLQEFQGKPLTPELFNTLFVAGGYKPAVPALFMVNRHTLEAYAVLFGEARPYELASRVKDLMAHIEEKYHV